MATIGVAERSQIDSFIVMDVMRYAAEKQRELEASGSSVCVLALSGEREEIARCRGMK
jgi:hypothetical protein